MVSVIIPNYNHSLYLNQRIDSVLMQSYQDFEIILLDDCSTDESRAIIESYRKNEKVSHIVYNENNSGSTFQQWKKGLDLCSGDLIWIAESDDYNDVGFLAEVATKFSENENLSIAYTQTIMFNENEILNGNFYKRLFHKFSGKEWQNENLYERETIINAGAAVFRRDNLEKINFNFTEFRFCGDRWFWFQMAALGDVFVSGKYLNFSRRTRTTVTNQSMGTAKSFIEYIKFNEEARKIFPLSQELKKFIDDKLLMDLLYIDIGNRLKDKSIRQTIYSKLEEYMPGFLKKYKLMRFKETAKRLLKIRDWF